MKKTLLVLLLTALSFVLVGQEKELSDYEKYRMTQEQELYETNEEVFYIVEDMPKFRGESPKEFRKWIAQNVKYPKQAIENGTTGKVIVSFVVNENGKVVNAKIEDSIDPYLDAEAIRVVLASPKWTAGKQRGKAVKVQFTFPINFVLDIEDDAEPVVINNYYNSYNQPDYRYLLTFGYGYHYRHYDPYYYDGYYRYNYGYYTSYYPHYRYNYGYYTSYYHHNHYYGHNYYNYGSKPREQRYYTSSALGRTKNYYQPYNKTYRSGYVSTPTAAKKNTYTKPVTTRSATTYTKNGTTTYTKNGTVTKSTRTYSPTYKQPRTSSRSTTKSTQQRSTTVRTPASTTRSTYNRPSSSSSRSSSSSYSRPSSSRSSSSYSSPSSRSSSSRTHSTPSRSSGGSKSKR